MNNIENKKNLCIHKYFNDSKDFFKSLSKIELVLSLTSWTISLVFFIIMCAIPTTIDGKTIYGVAKWQTWIGLIANLTNTMCVILSVKRKISSFIWGNISCVFLGAISFDSKVFGTTLTYWVICIISQTVLYFQWKRKSTDKKTIKPKKMNWYLFILYITITVLFSIGFAFIEGIDGFTQWWLNTSGKQSFAVRIFDSLGFMFTISSIGLLWYKYNQIWIIYLLGDGFLLALWCVVLSYNNWKINDINNSVNMFLALGTMVSLNICGMFNWNV